MHTYRHRNRFRHDIPKKSKQIKNRYDFGNLMITHHRRFRSVCIYLFAIKTAGGGGGGCQRAAGKKPLRFSAYSTVVRTVVNTIQYSLQRLLWWDGFRSEQTIDDTAGDHPSCTYDRHSSYRSSEAPRRVLLSLSLLLLLLYESQATMWIPPCFHP